MEGPEPPPAAPDIPGAPGKSSPGGDGVEDPKGPGDTPAPGAADGTSPRFSAARCTAYLVVVLAASVMASCLSLACWADHHRSERAVIMTRVEGKAESDGAVERASDWDPEFTQMLKDALGVDVESTDSSTGPGTWVYDGDYELEQDAELLELGAVVDTNCGKINLTESFWVYHRGVFYVEQ